MLWVREASSQKLNNVGRVPRTRRVWLQILSSGLVLIIVLALILFPNSKSTSGASLFAEWKTKADFENNASTTGAVTSQTNTNITGDNDAGDTNNNDDVKIQQMQAGTGNDGAVTFSANFNINTGTTGSRTQPDGFATTLSAAISQGATSITVTSSPAGAFAAGDELLITRVQDTTPKWETVRIASGYTTGNTIISLSSSIQSSGGFASGTLVQRVPNYSTVTINSGVAITANNWDGSIGGVVMFRVSGTLTNNGTIDVSGLMNVSNATGGAPYAGGGYGGTGGSASSYGGSGTNGGPSYGLTANPMLLGRAGLAGTASLAGNGGGMIFINANQVVNNGFIKSNGTNGDWVSGTYNYGGGGGSGGSVYLVSYADVSGATNIQAKGGNGGPSLNSGGGGPTGGSGGGGGRIRIESVPALSSGPNVSGGGYGCGSYCGKNGNPGTNSFANPPSFYTSGTISGLKINAGTGVKAKWSSINWASTALPANTSITFNVRTSDDNSTWSSWSSDYVQNTASSTTGSATFTGVSTSQYLEIKATLASSDGVNTPTLNSFRVDYDVIDAPGANISLERATARADGITSIANGGYTNETSVKLTGSSLTGLSDSTGLTFEVQKAESPAYTYRTDNIADASTDATPGNATATVTGLTAGNSYKFRARLKDLQGRYSAWTDVYGVGVDLTVEQTAPTGSVVIKDAVTGSTSYVTSNGTNNASLDFTTSDTDIAKVMASESSSFTAASWQNYVDPLPFSLSTGDATKTVYFKFLDNAGNTSSATDSSTQTTFTGSEVGAIYSSISPINSGADIGLSSIIVSSLTNAGGGSWSKKALISITNFQSSYQTKITVSYDADMQLDFDDLRFYDATSSTELPYWLESKTDGVSAVVWFKTGTNNNVYMYYGNASATSASSWSNTFAAAGTYASEISPDANTKGLWHFNEGTGGATADSSGNANNGGLVNTTWVAGKFGNALSFNGGGNSYVNAGSSATLDAETAGTLSMWLKTNGAITDVFSRSDGASWGNERFVLHSYGAGGGLDLHFANGSSHWYHYTTTNAIPTNQWVHFAATWDGTYVKFYIDGVLNVVRGQGGIPETTGVHTWIGKTEGLAGSFNGIIDEFRISNTPITYADVMKEAGVRQYVNPEPSPSIGAEQGPYTTSGTFTSQLVSPNPLTGWQTLTYTKSDVSNGGSGTISNVELLDSSGNLLSSYLNSGIDLSGLSPATYPSLKVRFTFSGNGASTPTVSDWSLSYVKSSDTIILDTAKPADVTELVGKTSVGFTDSGLATEIASSAWTQDTTLYFSWKASTDSDLDAAAPYKVYFGTSSTANPRTDAAAVVKTTNTYNPATEYAPAVSNGGVLPTGHYYLKIVAKDNAGNYSLNSKDYNVKVDNTAPVVTSITPTASTNNSSKVQVDWSAATDDSSAVTPAISGAGVDKYYVYYATRNVNNSELVPTDASFNDTNRYTQTITPDPVANITNTTFNHNGPDASLTYYYKVKAIDMAGNVSTLSTMGGPGYVADTTAPSASGTPIVSASSYVEGSTTKVRNSLTWSAASDNVGVSGYQIYYTTNALGTFPTDYTLATAQTATTYAHNNLIDNKTYYYRVRAYDAVPNTGPVNDAATATISLTSKATTPDVTSPAAPAFTTVTGASGYNATRNDIDWNKPADLSNDGVSAGVGVNSYRVYRSTNSFDGNTYPTVSSLPAATFGAITATVSSTASTATYQDTNGGAGLTPYTWYAYKLVALDASSNLSTDSATIWVRTKKDTQPVGVSAVSVSTPTTGDPSADATIGRTTTITFSGGASKNDVLDSYELYRSTTNYATDSQWQANATLIKTYSQIELAPVTSGVIGAISYNDKDTASSYSYTDTGLSDNTTYYYKIRVVDVIASEGGTFDSWTNSAVSVATKDITAPAIPGFIAVTDLYPKGTITSILGHPIIAVSWPHISSRVGHPTGSTDDVFVEYRLYRSTDGVSWGSAIYSGLTNYYVDETVSNNLSYYYKVTTADGTTYGGGSTATNESSGVVSTPINPGSLDKVAPALAGRSESVNASSATINLTFDESSEAIIELGTSAGNYTTMSGTPVRGTSPAIEFKKLTPGTTYHYRVIARDTSNNKLTSSNFSFTTPAFRVSNVAEAKSVNSATIAWNANASADSFVKYTNTKTGEVRIVANDELKSATGRHSLLLKGLSAGTRYAYQVISKDEFSNRATSTGTFTTDDFKVSDINVSTTASTATINWKTNEESDSFVDYGKKAVDEEQTGDRTSAKSHKVILKNLKPGTKYKFRVASKDSFNNIAIDSNNTFETKPFKIADIKVDTSTNTAIITWKTNIEANSLVEYRSDKEKVSKVAGDDRLVKEHKVEIRGLTAYTSYSYKIKSRDKDDNVAETDGILSFKTKSLEAGFSVNPTVSKLDELELTATSAKINWTTESETTSWVDYGKSTSLGKLAGNDTLTVDHIVELVGLTPGTTYYYRVKGEDESGNKYQSKIYSFTALIEPKIVGKPQVEVTNDTATITYKTNTDTDSIVEYGLTNKYGDSTGSGILTKEHKLEIKNLAQDTTYHYRVGAVDKFSNKTMGEDATFKTNKDTTGPKIDELRQEVLRQTDEAGREKISVIVNFTTDEEATSYVEYAEGISMATYNRKTRTNNTLNLSHSSLIEGLKPATTYHYRVLTEDKYGNMTKSQDRTILTPKESESVLQKIIKVLEETFGWVNNMRDYFNGKGKKK